MLNQPVLCRSRCIQRHRADYYCHLLAVTRDGNWEGWISFMIAAVTDTAKWTTAKIQAGQQLHTRTAAFVKTQASKIYTRELVDMLSEQPYCRIQNLAEADIAKRQTASVYLKQLTHPGMLREIKTGREKLFIHPTFVRLLTNDDHPELP